MGRDADLADPTKLTGRLPIWNDALGLFAEQPILGYGYGAFWSERRLSGFERRNGWALAHSHSAYIESLVNLGLAGFILGLFVAVITFAASLQLSIVAGNPPARLVAGCTPWRSSAALPKWPLSATATNSWRSPRERDYLRFNPSEIESPASLRDRADFDWKPPATVPAENYRCRSRRPRNDSATAEPEENRLQYHCRAERGRAQQRRGIPGLRDFIPAGDGLRFWQVVAGVTAALHVSSVSLWRGFPSP